MDAKTIVAGVLMDEKITISTIEVCQHCNISSEQLEEMIEHGLFKQVTHSHDLTFDFIRFRRILAASRLQQDLGINTPGVVLALDLLDELTQLREELSILQRHVDKS